MSFFLLYSLRCLYITRKYTVRPVLHYFRTYYGCKLSVTLFTTELIKDVVKVTILRVNKGVNYS